jgi:hypothetical protein
MMTPHSVIAGRVLDDEGEPITGADVQVSSLSYASGRKQLTRAGGASTNDLGEYRVFGLPAGKYFVTVTYRSTQSSPSGEEYATTYYPHTTDAAAAIPLTVAAGAQMRNIDITPARTRTVSVRGRINCDITGEKRTFTLMVTPRMFLGITTLSLGNRVSAVRPDGSFEITRVTPGSYYLMASATIDDKRYSSRTAIQVGSTDVEGLSVVVRSGGLVTGKVRVEGRPDEHLVGVSAGLRGWETGGVLFGPQPAGKVQPDGGFQLEDVGMDRYAFYTTGLPEGYYVKSVRSGGSDVLAAGFEAGGGAATFDVLVSPNAGSVEGTAIDPKSQAAFAGAMVALVPEAKDQPDRFRNATTDQEGHFRFRNLVPGEYRLFAWEDVPQYAWMDPDYMRELEPKGQRVTVEEGAHPAVQVTLIK